MESARKFVIDCSGHVLRLRTLFPSPPPPPVMRRGANLDLASAKTSVVVSAVAFCGVKLVSGWLLLLCFHFTAPIAIL